MNNRNVKKQKRYGRTSLPGVRSAKPSEDIVMRMETVRK